MENITINQTGEIIIKGIKVKKNEKKKTKNKKFIKLHDQIINN